MENVFVQIYPFVFMIGIAGYLPQICKLVRDRASADGMALSTWAIWTLTWMISLGYGITKLQDFMFCVVAGMNMAAHLAIIGIILYRRLCDAASASRMQFIRIRS